MRLPFKFLPQLLIPLLFSAALHAAATSWVLWVGGNESSDVTTEVWLVDESPRVRSVRPTHPIHKVFPRRVSATQAESLPASAALEPAGAVREPTTSDILTTANEIFDLSSPQTHPYFSRLRRILSDSKRGLIATEGSAEQFLIQIAIKGSGEIIAVNVSGEDSRLKSELKERMARIGFVPELPAEILFGKDHVEIRYRVLFSR